MPVTFSKAPVTRVRITSYNVCYTKLLRAFGADVISRIQASNDGKNEELKKIIRAQLSDGLNKLISTNNETVNQIVIAGNTTMTHLFMGYSCETLGVFPFDAA